MRHSGAVHSAGTLPPDLLEGGVPYLRITVDADQMGGVPCIRSLRVPVATVVGMVADGMTDAAILDAYPDLEAEDIREALQFAAETVRSRPTSADGLI